MLYKLFSDAPATKRLTVVLLFLASAAAFLYICTLRYGSGLIHTYLERDHGLFSSIDSRERSDVLAEAQAESRSVFYFDRRQEKHQNVYVDVGGENIEKGRVGGTSIFWLDLRQFQGRTLYVWFWKTDQQIIFCPSKIDRQQPQKTMVSFTAPKSGEYHIFIDLIDLNNSTHPIVRVAGSPFLFHATQQSLPARAMVTSVKVPCTDGALGWNEGFWQRSQSHTKSGWKWQPNNCDMQYRDPKQLLKIQDPIWIVFTGSSVQRGTFFTLLDSILGTKAENLTKSDFWKCWGWMDFQTGNLRLSYLDFRTPYMIQEENYNCDNEDIESSYLNHGMYAFKYLGTLKTAPDIIYSEVSTAFSWWDTTVMRSWLGTAWKGKLIITPEKPNFGSKIWPDQNLSDEIRRNGKMDIDIVDEFHLALPMWHTMEGEPFMNPGRAANHYHQSCTLRNLHVCTIASEVSMQMLLSFMHEWPVGYQEKEDSPEFQFCLSCPDDLVPFTIDYRRIFDNRCFDFIPISKNG